VDAVVAAVQRGVPLDAVVLHARQLRRQRGADADESSPTMGFEKQRAMNQVRQWVFQQTVKGALGTLNSYLNIELHYSC